MPSFKVPCPSCEAPVLIKNPNLVGTKVECPKCKYRFKVEEPAAEAGAAGKADKKPDKAEKAEKKAKAGGKNKKLVPVIAGVLGLVVLVGVGVAVFGGGKVKKIDPFAQTSRGGGGGGGGGGEPAGEPTGEDKKAPPVVPAVPGSDKVTTNLLPGQAVAVYRLNMNLVRGTPAHAALIDQPVAAMFQGTLGFAPDDVDTYIHCFAGDAREPFGVVKLKTPAKAPELLAKMPLGPKPKAVKGRDLHEFRAAPLMHGISQALAMRSLFGEMYATLPAAPATPPKDKPYGVCVYDTQHVLVGDYALLERFLRELGENGYPPFKSELIVVTVAPTPTGTPAPPAPAGAPPDPPKTPAPPAPAPEDKAYTQIDAYRTLEVRLKRALDQLEADRPVPLVVYAEKFDARQYDPKLMKKEYQALATTLDPITSRLWYLGANVTTFNYRQLSANLRLTFADGKDASELVREKLGPALPLAVEALKLYLTTAIEFFDHTLPGTNRPDNPSGMGLPPGRGGLPGMGSTPGVAPFPGMGGPAGGPPRLGSGGPPGMGSGEGLPGPGPKGPRPGQLPGPGGPGMGGINPGGPGSMDPGREPKDPNALPPSRVDLLLEDDWVLIAIDITWNESVFRTVLGPRMAGVANQIKGKMAVFATESSRHVLAAAGPKALAAARTFPRGTWDRAKTDPDRLGLEYPPVQRVSLFAELLPHLGRDRLAAAVNRNASWYALEYEPQDPNNPYSPLRKKVDNLTPGGEWVPELLVPSYPPSAWRATSPYAPDHTFGATNYVAISGTGLDSARYDPKSTDPETKKKLGMTGYGWGSRAEDVTDGLANTIYLMQTPPGLQQPWIAGGGATVRGFDEDDPMGTFKSANGGKPGAYALMGDGSVRFVPAHIDKKVLLAMGTRAGADGAALADIDLTAPRVDPPKAAVPAGPTGEPRPVVATKPLEKTDEKKGTEPPANPGPASKADPAPAPREKK